MGTLTVNDTDPWHDMNQPIDDREAGLDPDHRPLYAPHFAGERRVIGKIRRNARPPGRVAAAGERQPTQRRLWPRTLVCAEARSILATKALLIRALGAAWAGHRGQTQGGSAKSRAAHAAIFVVALASCFLLAPAAQADSPARERELTCSDGTVFTGEQVRHGSDRPPSVWRGVTPSGDPVAFVFRAVTLTAPDGTVDEAESWDNTAGVVLSQDLITCSFVIPVGPLTGYQADFVGFFVPVRN